MAQTPRHVDVTLRMDATPMQQAMHRVAVASMLRDAWMRRATAVLDLHRPSNDHNPDMHAYCVGCWEAGGMDGAPSWPCPTVRLLTGTNDDEETGQEVPD